MRSYNLNIAGYKIRIETTDDGPELIPSDRFLKNICFGREHDVLIRVRQGAPEIPEEAERVFVAPYVIEVKGIKINRKENFWSVYRDNVNLYITATFPSYSKKKNAMLRFSLLEREWDLWLDEQVHATDPLEYPLDGLILYYLTAINDDIMIHASGVNYAGNGYLFSGVSGRGKTTMAKLWDESGAKVIHDDRLIIRNVGGAYRMFNTPVYKDDYPNQSPLSKIFIIGHGPENEIAPLKGASAVSSVVANCIQHNWDPEMIARFLGSVSIMCSMVPTVNLSFIPDTKVIDFILSHENEPTE